MIALVTACESADERLKGLTVGITKDSTAKVMGVAPQKEVRFLVNGQYVESMYYPKSQSTAKDRLEDRRMTPVVVVNGKVGGWGWAYWDSVAAANKYDLKTTQ
ncbi:MAG: hypothetical protein ABI647_17750 [Gemmatimonadota bacterium]